MLLRIRTITSKISSRISSLQTDPPLYRSSKPSSLKTLAKTSITPRTTSMWNTPLPTTITPSSRRPSEGNKRIVTTPSTPSKAKCPRKRNRRSRRGCPSGRRRPLRRKLLRATRGRSNPLKRPLGCSLKPAAFKITRTNLPHSSNSKQIRATL